MKWNEMIVIVLPSFQSTALGYGALYGSGSVSCSLIMRSTLEMIRNG